MIDTAHAWPEIIHLRRKSSIRHQCKSSGHQCKVQVVFQKAPQKIWKSSSILNCIGFLKFSSLTRLSTFGWFSQSSENYIKRFYTSFVCLTLTDSWDVLKDIGYIWGFHHLKNHCRIFKWNLSISLSLQGADLNEFPQLAVWNIRNIRIMENSMTQWHFYILFASWGAADVIKDFVQGQERSVSGKLR